MTATRPRCLLLALLLAVICVAAASAQQINTFLVPEIKFSALTTMDMQVATTAADILTSVGAIQISGIPNFATVRKQALSELASCYEAQGAAPALVMADGARRLTCGAASHKGKADSMSHPCGAASEGLRQAVDQATQLLFAALDRVASARTHDLRAMEPTYNTLAQVMASGEHLEHLHAYVGANTPSTPTSPAATMNYHLDAGLMIAMTTGHYSESASETSGLYLMLPDGSTAKALAMDDALLVLMGDGAEHWLAPVLGKPFHAPAHALIADLKAGVSRAWYGKMYLPPADAVIPAEKMTFAQFHALQAKHSVPLTKARGDSATPLGDVLPSACGGRLVHAFAAANGTTTTTTVPGYVSAVADNCPDNTIMCWAQCMSTAGLACSSDEAVCADKTTGQPVANPSAMCMDSTGVTCAPACPAYGK